MIEEIDHDAEENSHLTKGRGRSKKKREAQRIEDLAKQLIELSPQNCARIGISDRVIDEITIARDTDGRGSSKRQLKHLAGVLREEPEDVEKINIFIDGYDQTHYKQKKAFHKLEEFRDQLCDPKTTDQTIGELSKLISPAELKPLRGLARSVIKSGDKKASRDIFKKLRELLGEE